MDDDWVLEGRSSELMGIDKGFVEKVLGRSCVDESDDGGRIGTIDPDPEEDLFGSQVGGNGRRRLQQRLPYQKSPEE